MSEQATSRDARHIAAILRAGLVASLAALVLAIVVAARHLPVEEARMAPSDMSFARSPSPTLAMLGLLVLGATPALRVLALVVLWARERDRRFALTAAVVAAVLALSAVLGHG